MNLSEAMRKGATMTKGLRDGWIVTRKAKQAEIVPVALIPLEAQEKGLEPALQTVSTITKACALSAAFAAAFGTRVIGDPNVERAVSRQWPGLSKMRTCPQSQCMKREPIDDLIVHLNDRHFWSRNRIADWVETLEQQGVL